MSDLQAEPAAVDLLAFEVGGARFGIELTAVREVVRAVFITPLPGAPPTVEGIIDVRGTVVPVYDLRTRFGLPIQPLHPDHRLVTAWTGDRLVALHCERTEWLVSVPASAMERTGAVSLGDRRLAGVAKLPDGIILITDLPAFLDDAERTALDAALAAASAPPHGTSERAGGPPERGAST
ncbi:MAG TPA: chemotaxis protein CheW [Longimicrobiales bacterium]|nr:chemotaxis protein CheW [Longimicrobiales bacterium]